MDNKFITLETTPGIDISVEFKDGETIVTSNVPISREELNLLFPIWAQNLVKNG